MEINKWLDQIIIIIIRNLHDPVDFFLLALKTYKLLVRLLRNAEYKKMTSSFRFEFERNRTVLFKRAKV